MRTYADIIVELPGTATPVNNAQNAPTPRQMLTRIMRMLCQLDEADLVIVYRVARNLRNEKEFKSNEG